MLQNYAHRNQVCLRYCKHRQLWFWRFSCGVVTCYLQGDKRLHRLFYIPREQFPFVLFSSTFYFFSLSHMQQISKFMSTLLLASHNNVGKTTPVLLKLIATNLNLSFTQQDFKELNANSRLLHIGSTESSSIPSVPFAGGTLVDTTTHFPLVVGPNPLAHLVGVAIGHCPTHPGFLCRPCRVRNLLPCCVTC